MQRHTNNKDGSVQSITVLTVDKLKAIDGGVVVESSTHRASLNVRGSSGSLLYRQTSRLND